MASAIKPILRQIDRLLKSVPVDEQPAISKKIFDHIAKRTSTLPTKRTKELPGFMFHPKRNSYYLTGQLKGYRTPAGKVLKWYHRSLGPDKNEALQLYHRIRAQITDYRRGITSHIPMLDNLDRFRTNEQTFREAAEKIKYKFGWDGYGVKYPHILTFFGDLKIESLTELDVTKFINHLLTEHNSSDETVKKYVYQVSKFLNCLIRQHRYTINNVVKQRLLAVPVGRPMSSLWSATPAAKNRKQTTSRRRQKQYITPATRVQIVELARIYGTERGWGDELAIYFQILMYTALRPGSVRSLVFTQDDNGNYIDLPNREIVLRNSKTTKTTGRTEKIAINPELFDILKATYDQREPQERMPVFRKIPLDINKTARKYFDAVGFKHLMPYSIKHSVVTDAMNAPDADYRKLSEAVHINEATLQKHYRLASNKDNPLCKLTYKNLSEAPVLEQKAVNQ